MKHSAFVRDSILERPSVFNCPSHTHKYGGLQKQLPETPGQWHKLLAKLGLEKSTIHTVDLASASKIGLDQFLLLRVLWKKHEKRKDVIGFLGLQDWVEKAQKELLRL